MTNITSTDVAFGGAWYNRVVAKQEDSHSTAPADKQINEQRYIQPPPIKWIKIYSTAPLYVLDFSWHTISVNT